MGALHHPLQDFLVSVVAALGFGGVGEGSGGFVQLHEFTFCMREAALQAVLWVHYIRRGNLEVQGRRAEVR